MKKKNILRNQILMGIIALSAATVPMLIASPTEAAQKSLYDEYQETQRIQSNQSDAVVEQNQTAAAQSTVEPTVHEVSATDFTDRIQAILNAYHAEQPGHSDYSRFLQQPDVVDAENSTVKEQKTAAAEQKPAKMKPAVTESTAAPSKTLAVAVPKKEETPAQSKAESADEPVDKPSLPTIPVTVNKPNLAEGKYNFMWKGTPLTQSLYALGSIANKGIVVNGDLKGTVYANLRQVSCNTALDYLSRVYGFNWMTDGNNIIISTEKEMLQSEVFQVDYANKDKLKEEFVALGIDTAHVYSNSETGTVSVTGTPYQLQQARERLKTLDKPVAQCLFVAQLVEVNHGKNIDLGMTYSLPTYSHTGSETGSYNVFQGSWLPKLTFSATSEASRSLSKGHVISRPMVLSKNGEKANVMFGDRVPIFSSTSTSSSTDITVKYQDVGTSLDITPVINESTGDISINLKAEVSTITGWQSNGSSRAPQISTRDVTTSAHLKSGQSLVIGGLMNSTDVDNLSGIPGLMNLPILGSLFRYHTQSKSYTEVFIMVTPYIMDDGLDARKIVKQVQQ